MKKQASRNLKPDILPSTINIMASSTKKHLNVTSQCQHYFLDKLSIC